MRWLKILVSTLVILAVAFVAVGFLLPSGYEVERRITIAATTEQIHPLVEDLERWSEWEPWREGDPTIKVTLGGTTKGVGAHQSWTGETGDGELTITESSPAGGIRYDMSFDGGAWLSEARIRYEPQGASTEVVWTMEGDTGSNPIGRYFGLLLDSLTGPMFERGLEKLKAAVEK